MSPPLAHACFAASIFSCEEATKFHQMYRRPFGVSPSTISRAPRSPRRTEMASPGRNTIIRPLSKRSPVTSIAPSVLPSPSSNGSGCLL